MLTRANTRPRKRNAGRPAEKSAPAFLQWLRGRECVCAPYGGCSGRIEAAHVDYAGGKGIATKVADRFTIPACSEHHRRQHQIGWPRFEAEYQINALALANGFWSAWPGRAAYERKLADG